MNKTNSYLTKQNYRPHILIIDDNINLCISIKIFLEDTHQFIVDYTISAEEGLDYLKTHPDIDVIFLDIDLGFGLSGRESISLIRDINKYVQIIMITSMNSLEIGIECMKKGALDYLTKPVNQSELIQKIQFAFDKKHNLQINDLYLDIIVHDLRNPLTTILGTIQYFKSSFNDNLSSNEQLLINNGEKSVHHIRDMCDNILSLSKFENGKYQPNFDSFLLNPFIDTILIQFENDYTNGPNRIKKINSIKKPFTFCSDKNLIQSIINNILSNALRYTPESGEIIFDIHHYSKNNDVIEISITNSGSYIDEQVQKLLFDKFSKIYDTSKRASIQNYGLGLTFCKIAVLALGGTIWVESNKQNLTTTFHFTLKNN